MSTSYMIIKLNIAKPIENTILQAQFKVCLKVQDTSDSNEFYVQSGNVHTFYLPMLGSWTIAAVKGGISTTTSIYIERVGTYDVSLSYFNAYISVTYPIGATCTYSNGIDIYYANNTDGSYTFTVNRARGYFFCIN